MLKQRQDMKEEANNIIGQLESTRDNVLTTARNLQEQAKSQADECIEGYEEYLRNTNKERIEIL
jgi:hypothetical protein